ncbi:MAG: ABC transporter substrate-binding protein [Anaerolineaceae bacterium]|nr:ABC transporter substrate-binding protein [Anaerolineaceae bacterium]
MSNIRRFFCAVFLAAILASCGGGAQPSTSPADSSEGITLDFWYALGGDSGKVVEELVDQFNQSQSGITVVPTYQGDYTAAMAKIYSAITSDSTPNVIQVGGAPLLGSSGALVPMSDLIANDDSFAADQIHPAFLEYNSVQGVLWSMPFNNSVPVLYYNKDLFTAAGLDPEDPPANLDELLAAARQLTLAPDQSGVPAQWGLNARDDSHWYLSTLFLENGDQIVNDEMTAVTYDSPEAVAMLQQWADWVNQDGVMPPNQHSEAQSDFLAGKLGMFMGSSATLNSLDSNAPFELGVAVFPAVGDVQKYPIGGGSLAIFKNSDERAVQASWEFVKFMTSRDSAAYLATHTGYLPVYADAFSWPEIQQSIQDEPQRAAAIQALEHVVAIPVFPALGNSDLALRMAIQEVELGHSTPQASLEKAKASVDKSIAEQAQDQ